ncbi:hypothetical protein, partial [Vibrio parahaemolyticus]|uniref:hypothetical protein n=2 Tax=Vibrio TaxID=662 RepID=UPI001EEB4CBC
EEKNREFRNFQKITEKGNLYKDKIGILQNRGNELKEYIRNKQDENRTLSDDIKTKQKQIQHLDQKILLSKKDISQKNDELEVINKELQFKKTMNKDLGLIDKFKIKMFDYVISVINYFDTKLDFKLKNILSDSFYLFNNCDDKEKE